MKNRLLWVGVFGLFCLLVVIVNHAKRPESKAAKPLPADSNRVTIEEFIKAPSGTEAMEAGKWKSEANFYGRVLDLNGAAVSGATVTYARPSIPWLPLAGQKNTGRTKSDTDGNFSITHYQAPELDIGVEADGYYSTNESYGHYQFATFPARMLKELPPGIKVPIPHQADPATPVIFRLRKMGPARPLFCKSATVWFGQSSSVCMEYVQVKNQANGHAIVIEGNVDRASARPGKASNQPYFDWWIEIRVPGGGAVVCTDQSEITAPATGYHEKIRMAYYAAEAPDNWAANPKLHFFVRYGDGTYAQVSLYPQPDTSGRCLCAVESRYDPAGGRYFEFDKSKALDLKEE